MDLELNCNCNCWNEEALRLEAERATSVEEAQKQLPEDVRLVVTAGKIACHGKRPNGDCGALTIFPRFEDRILRSFYAMEFVDQGVMGFIPGFSRLPPTDKSG